jgi:YVTN family beta-propeller protein
MTFSLTTRRLRLSALVAVIGLAVALAALAQSSFSVQNRWKIGGEGGWDYLIADSAAQRLYITHGSRVEVLDSSTGKSIGAITGLKGIHGVALEETGKYGYVSDGGANAVIVFDRQSLQVVTSIPAGTGPDGITFEPVTKTVWAFNGRSKDATVIDTATQKAIATVPLPGRPEFAVADGKGNVYDNIEDKSEIVRIDAKSHTITATWPLSPCEGPSGLAIDREGNRLFAVCDGKKMAVVDANTGKVVATPAIGDHPDAAAYDPKAKLAFSSNGDGTLTVIDASNSSYKVLQNLATEQGARTMTLDSATGKVYLVFAKSGPRPAEAEGDRTGPPSGSPSGPPTGAQSGPPSGPPSGRPSYLSDSFTVLVVGR